MTLMVDGFRPAQILENALDSKAHAKDDACETSNVALVMPRSRTVLTTGSVCFPLPFPESRMYVCMYVCMYVHTAADITILMETMTYICNVK